MKKEDIDRINELARKAKTVGLTPEENEERAVLRRAYIDSVVGDLRQQLDNTYIVDSKGNNIGIVALAVNNIGIVDSKGNKRKLRQ